MVFALVLSGCKTETEAPEVVPTDVPVEPTEKPPEPTEKPPEPTEEPAALGDEDYPIKVLFVPSVDVDFMIESGDLIEQALNEATGMYFEVSVPTSYAATIEEMCASTEDTIGFIPAMGYALANSLCGVEPGLASVRYGWNVYWTQFIVQRDSAYETLKILKVPPGRTRMLALHQDTSTHNPSSQTLVSRLATLLKRVVTQLL
jgi:phosphonate transport system substrate-binding protein